MVMRNGGVFCFTIKPFALGKWFRSIDFGLVVSFLAFQEEPAHIAACGWLCTLWTAFASCPFCGT
eukprot:6463679-Amphidinium_carterae.1